MSRAARSAAYITAGRNRIGSDGLLYDLSQPECIQLVSHALMGTSEAYDAICNAFYMGVEAGARLTEKRLINGKGYAIRRTI